MRRKTARLARRNHRLEHLVRRKGCVDVDQQSPIPVVGDQGGRGGLVDLEAVADRLLLVVVPLDQGLSGLVVDAFDLGRVVENVVGSSGALAYPSSGKAAYDRLLVKDEVDDPVEVCHGCKRVGLCNRAGKSVEDESALRIILLQPLVDHRDGDLVRNEIACSENRLDTHSKPGLVLDVLPEQVSRGDVGDAVYILRLRGDRSLAGPGRAEKD